MALSLNEFAVLTVLGEEPRHGFAVARELQRDAPLGTIWRVARPQVYRSVDKVVGLGLATLGPAEPGDGPERHVATLTPEGRATVEQWAVEPVERLRQLRSELLFKLLACRRLGLDGATLIERQSAVIATISHHLADELATTHDDRRIALLWRQASADAAEAFLRTAARWWQTRN
jgi:DNA-binding PadR family transcriptional regulator